MATNITFNFPGTPVLPNTVIYGIAYNTTSYGPAPIGTAAPCFSTPAGCFYDSLNIGLAPAVIVGSKPFPDTVFQDTVYASNYCDGGTAGTGSFRLDSPTSACWADYIPAVKFTATAPAVVPPPLDHFKCYTTSKEEPKFVKEAGIGLFDPLLDEEEQVIVQKPVDLCAPALKAHGAPPVANPAVTGGPHLMLYEIKDDKGTDFPKFVKRTVTVADQFGTRTQVVQKPKYLMVPAAKALPPAEPGAVPVFPGHFKCYQVEKEQPKWAKVPGIGLRDQFGPEQVIVYKPSCSATRWRRPTTATSSRPSSATRTAP